MKWYRMYPEARTDDKLRTLTDSEHRVWFNLLCLSAEPPEERGTIKSKGDVWLAAKVARGGAKARLALLMRTLGKLEPLDIIKREGDKIIFVHFPDRQYEYPSEEPERVTERTRRHRQKARNGGETNGKQEGNEQERAGTPPEIRTQRSEEDVPDPRTSDQAHSAKPLQAKQAFLDAPPNQRVAKLVDLGDALGFQRSGGIAAAIVTAFGYKPERIVEVMSIALGKAKGDPWKYVRKTLGEMEARDGASGRTRDPASRTPGAGGRAGRGQARGWQEVADEMAVGTGEPEAG